jgi:hypothetical protein
MRDGEGFEVDRAAGAAWRRFQARLADRLAGLGEDDILLVEALAGDEPEVGAVPYVQFCAWGDGMLRGEVSSDHVLAVERCLGAAGAQLLREIGYAAPTHTPDEGTDHGSVNHFVDAEQVDADRLAVMATRALRDVFGVPHPALLAGDVAGDDDVPVEGAAFERAEEADATYPHDGHEELTALVDRALTPYFGHEPQHDGDGDIPVEVGRTVVFVRVSESVPVVEIFGCVATDVTDHERALFEVNVLNRDVRFVKFRLVGDTVLADLQLPSWPFAPEHLRAMLALTCDVVEKVQDDLVARVGGRHLLDTDEERCVRDGLDEEADDEADDEAWEDDEDTGGAEDADHAPAAEELGPAGEVDGPAGELGGDEVGAGDGPPDEGLRGRAGERERRIATNAALVLAQLQADRADSVTPELAASICRYDLGLILDMLRAEEEEQIAWRQTRRAAVAAGDDDDLVEVCDGELDYSERSLRLLRGALRVVVERQAAQDAADPPPVIVPPRRPARKAARPKRPRRVPDPTIEEVDPDIWG